MAAQLNFDELDLPAAPLPIITLTTFGMRYSGSGLTQEDRYLAVSSILIILIRRIKFNAGRPHGCFF
jgi:hypothetical protein